jgi:hypothetical protein
MGLCPWYSSPRALAAWQRAPELRQVTLYFPMLQGNKHKVYHVSKQGFRGRFYAGKLLTIRAQGEI